MVHTFLCFFVILSHFVYFACEESHVKPPFCKGGLGGFLLLLGAYGPAQIDLKDPGYYNGFLEPVTDVNQAIYIKF